jgi:hypothetical protein
MYKEYFEDRECDHDDDVMCTHAFFDHTTRAHLARQRLKALLDAGTHWIIGMTPELDLMGRAARLGAIHLRFCGEGIGVLHLPEIKAQPVLCTLPKEKVSLDDVLSVIGPLSTSRGVIESKPWILLTSSDVKACQEAVNRWIQVEPLYT